MDTLFPIEPLYPNGFRYEADFITPEEEAVLLKVIGQVQLHTFKFQGYEA